MESDPFVFLDDASRPFLVQKWGDAVWLFYWNSDHEWVSLRKPSQIEVWEFAKKAMPQKDAALYGLRLSSSGEK